jgi:hypothetical protein
LTDRDTSSSEFELVAKHDTLPGGPLSRPEAVASGSGPHGARESERMTLYRVFWLFAAVLAVLAVFAIWLGLQSDNVVLSGTSGFENGILVSAMEGTVALQDKTFTSTNGTIDVGHLTAAAGRNEVIAFTNSRPVGLLPMAPWTASHDTINLAFAGEIGISVTIWIMQSPFLNQSLQAADRCIAIAAMWTAERMGVAFSPGGCDIRDATTVGNISQFMAFNCSKQDRLQAAIPPVAGRINIYVVNTVQVNSGWGTGNGTSCGASDFEALGSTVDAGVAIHELGHNFSLTHIDSAGLILPGFDANNIMHSASMTRQYFTEGQLFRAHLTPANPTVQQPGSALNSVYTSARAGQPVRDCTAEPCPDLAKRIWADGALPPN